MINPLGFLSGDWGGVQQIARIVTFGGSSAYPALKTQDSVGPAVCGGFDGLPADGNNSCSPFENCFHSSFKTISYT